jgi:hypothetical protein
LDITVNGKNAGTNVGFGASAPAAGYTSISPGNNPMEAFLTGTSTSVIGSTPLNLVAGTQSTVVLSGLFAAPTAFVFPDNNTAPLADQVEIRMIHASPSAPDAVDIYLVSPGTDISQLQPTLSALPFGHASDYVSLPTLSSGFAQIMVIVTATGNKTPQILNQIYTPSVGQIRTLVLVDVAPGGGALSFVPLELNDYN